MTEQQQGNKERQHSPPTFGYRGLCRTAVVPPCAVSIQDLRKLYTQLSGMTSEALDNYLNSINPQPGQDAAQLDALKKEARRIGGLTVIVIGAKGEQVVETSVEALSDENLPDKIMSITFDSASTLQRFNVSLLNRFRLNLDFKEPLGFHAYNPWNQPTLNNSSLEVIGPNTTWVTGVYETVLSFFRERKRKRGWLHSQNTFNILNWGLGFPGALWLTYRLDSFFQTTLQDLHVVLRGALYVYLVLLGLLAFRAVIAGFRWILPVVELEGSRSKKVRGVLGFVLSSFLLMLLYDVIKSIFWSNS